MGLGAGEALSKVEFLERLFFLVWGLGEVLSSAEGPGDALLSIAGQGQVIFFFPMA